MSNLLTPDQAAEHLQVEFLTPQEIADRLKLNATTVRELFRNISGVVKIQSPTAGLMKNRKRAARETLRIPIAVYERWVKNGGSELQERRRSVH